MNIVIERRTFAALLAGAAVLPKRSWVQVTNAKTVFYASVGPDLNLYGIDVDAATLTRRWYGGDRDSCER